MSSKLANYYKVSLDYLYGISHSNTYVKDRDINYSLLCTRWIYVKFLDTNFFSNLKLSHC